MLTSKFGELWSPARQQIWPWSRSKVNVKVTIWCQLKGPVTGIMHAKYQCSITNTSEDMSQVKVFVTDRGTDGRTNEIKCPPLSRKAEDKKEQFVVQLILKRMKPKKMVLRLHKITVLININRKLLCFQNDTNGHMSNTELGYMCP